MSCCGSAPKPEEMKSCDTKSGCGCGCGSECKCGPDCQCKKGGCGDKAAYCASQKCCPIKGVLTVLLGGLLAAMVMYLFEGFWHGTYLAPIYEQTKNLWRTTAEMQSLGGFYTGITIALGLTLSLIFAQKYEGKCIGEGIRYGFLIGVLLGIKSATAYVYMPISIELIEKWFFGWIIEGVLVGITLALTYKAMIGKKADGYKGCCKPKSSCGTEKTSCSK